MHEMSLCEGVLDILKTEAVNQGYKRVMTVWLEIGELSGVEPDAMMFSFDAVTRGSLADGAKLVIVPVPGESWCMKCSKNIKVKQRFDCCPDCGSYQLQVVSGDEMKIKELEVE